MNGKPFFSILILIVFICCKDKAPKANPNLPTEIVPGNENHFKDNILYKTLVGTIAGKEIVMHFLKYNDQVDANYYYVEKGQPIYLFKDWEKESKDSIYLLENNPGQDDKSARITLFIGDSSLNGYWMSDDGKKIYPLELKEKKEITGLTLSAFGIIDSAKYIKFKKDTPRMDVEIVMTQANGEDEASKWFNSKLKNLLSENKTHQSLPLYQTAQAIAKEYVDGYKSEVDSSLVGLDSGPDDEHYFLNRSYTTIGNIIYNENNFIVYSYYNYDYTGGAHGNYGTSFMCYDVLQKKELKLTDILRVDSTTLSSLLEKKYRKDYDLSASTPISERLFVNKIPVSENFYFTTTGIGFTYIPYEIASYADGQINLWISFSDLKLLLNPDFAKRMNLQIQP